MKGQHPAPLDGVDQGAAQDDGEVGERGHDHEADDRGVQSVGGQDPGQDEDGDTGQRRDGDAGEACAGRHRQWVGHLVRAVRQTFAPEAVLHQPEGHPDGRESEAPVEAELGLQEPGEQRTDQGTQGDAEVEQREAGVPARVVA